MKTALKAARASLALALILLSPGLEPYAAAAGNFASGARVSPTSFAAPAAMPGLGAVALPQSALSLSPNLSAGGVNVGVSLPGSAVAGAQAPAAALAGAHVPAAGPISAETPAHSTWNVPAALPAAAPARSASAPAAVSARHQLSVGARQITAAAAPSGSVESGAAALDSVFSGAKLGASDVSGPVSAGAQRSFGPVLGKSDGRSGAETGGQEPQAPQAPQAPRQSLGRSARVGLIAAIVPIAITMATMAVASALGYHFHAGYQAPFPQQMTAVTAVTSLIAAAFMAPVAEEMIFRGGIMGWLTKHTPESFGPTLRFAIPAVLSSLVFVAVHELSDPVLFATRFVHSMILSYAFHKEGYTGSMFAHGFFNGLLFMPVLLGILLPGAAGTVAAMALTPLTLYLGYKAARKVWAERGDKKSGKLVAYQVSPLGALALVAALMAGYFFIMPNIIWPIGAIGWLGYAIRRWKAGRR